MESHYHCHLSLHAFRLKFAFSSKITKYGHYEWSNSRQSHGQWTHQNSRTGYGWPCWCLTHHDMKRCYFPPTPRLNLSICNGQILIWAAEYTVHHHEILNSTHTVYVQEVDRIHNNMKKVTSVSWCLYQSRFPVRLFPVLHSGIQVQHVPF